MARYPFRFEGPIVDGLRAAFLDNWAETDPVLYDAGIDRFPEQPQPGSAVTQGIRGASETGWSDVATLRPFADKRVVQLAAETSYSCPLDHGVSIWNYQPTMLHAKLVTVAALDDHFEEGLDRSVRIQPRRWGGRSVTQRTVEQLVVPLRRFF